MKTRQQQLTAKSDTVISSYSRGNMATQVTPSLSRIEDRRENETTLKNCADRLNVAELQNQQIEISVRKLNDEHRLRVHH